MTGDKALAAAARAWLDVQASDLRRGFNDEDLRDGPRRLVARGQTFSAEIVHERCQRPLAIAHPGFEDLVEVERPIVVMKPEPIEHDALGPVLECRRCPAQHALARVDRIAVRRTLSHEWGGRLDRRADQLKPVRVTSAGRVLLK